MSKLNDLKKKAFASEALGLCCETDGIKAALLTKEKGKISVSFCRSFPLDQRESFSSVLSKKSRIVCGIESHEIVLRSLSLPLKAKARVIDALPFQLEAMLPFPADQAIACPFLKPIDAYSTSVLLIATSKDIVKRHLNRLASSHIHPDVLTCAPLALFRLARYLYPEQKDLLFFHFGREKTSCIAIHNSELALSHSLRFGAADLAEPKFFERLEAELGRFSVFFKEKLNLSSEETSWSWALIGENSVQLREAWKNVFSANELLIPEESLHTHGLAIGFALDALAADARRVQLLQNEFTPVHHVKIRKKRAWVYALSCLALTLITALCTTVALQKKTKTLSEKMAVLLPSSKNLSLNDMEIELYKTEVSLSKQKNGFPFFLTVPKVSEVLSWLSTHPCFATPDGFPKEGIDIKSFRYQLTRFPNLDEPTQPYHALIDIEFTATTPRLAREFHDALLKGDRIVNAKKELKWNTHGNIYSAQFELNKSAAL